MQFQKVKYVLWAADWQRCLKFYRELFGGVVSFESEVWSEIVIAGATLCIHGGGEGKRTWTGLSCFSTWSMTRQSMKVLDVSRDFFLG